MDDFELDPDAPLEFEGVQYPDLWTCARELGMDPDELAGHAYRERYLFGHSFIHLVEGVRTKRLNESEHFRQVMDGPELFRDAEARKGDDVRTTWDGPFLKIGYGDLHLLGRGRRDRMTVKFRCVSKRKKAMLLDTLEALGIRKAGDPVPGGLNFEMWVSAKIVELLISAVWRKGRFSGVDFACGVIPPSPEFGNVRAGRIAIRMDKWAANSFHHLQLHYSEEDVPFDHMEEIRNFAQWRTYRKFVPREGHYGCVAVAPNGLRSRRVSRLKVTAYKDSFLLSRRWEPCVWEEWDRTQREAELARSRRRRLSRKARKKAETCSVPHDSAWRPLGVEGKWTSKQIAGPTAPKRVNKGPRVLKRQGNMEIRI